MSSAIDVLRDVILEAQTASRDLEYDDPVAGSFQYIEDMTKVAIEKLTKES